MASLVGFMKDCSGVFFYLKACNGCGDWVVVGCGFVKMVNDGL